MKTTTPSVPPATGTDAVRGTGTVQEAAGHTGLRPPYWQVRLWRTLRTDPLRALLVGVVLGVVLAFLGAIGSLGGSTTWTSKTVMLINDPFALATAGDQGQLLKLDALRIKYSGLVATNVIAQPVARELNLPTEKVLKSVTTQVPLESLLMNVVATWSNPNEARRLSQAVADQVTNYVMTENVTYGIPAKDQFTFNVVDPASNPVSSGPSGAQAAVVAIVLAIIGLILGFVITQFVRNRALLT